jgi:transposase-like protein
LSARDIEALMRERDVSVAHTTAFRWVQRYAPGLDKRCRPSLTETNDSDRVEETYLKVTKQWDALDRAGDSAGQTIDCLLQKTRDATAAERCVRKALQATHTATPRAITVDTPAAYPPAFETLHQEGQRPARGTLRQCTYVNPVVAQDHRLLKRRGHPGRGFGAYRTAWRPIQGDEAMPRLRQGQVEGIAREEVRVQHRVIARIFGLVA